MPMLPDIVLPKSARAAGALQMARERDYGLSEDAKDVREALERIARQYREEHGWDATAPKLVLLLMRWYAPARLKRKWRP